MWSFLNLQFFPTDTSLRASFQPLITQFEKEIVHFHKSQLSSCIEQLFGKEKHSWDVFCQTTVLEIQGTSNKMEFSQINK